MLAEEVALVGCVDYYGVVGLSGVVEVLQQLSDILVDARHRAKVVKNKVAPPFRICELDILNDGGISYLGSLIDEAINQDVIQKAGAFLKYKGEVIAQGREAARKELSKKPKLVAKIEKEIWASINNAK